MNDEDVFQYALEQEPKFRKLYEDVLKIKDDGASFCRRSYMEGFRGYVALKKQLDEVVKNSRALQARSHYSILYARISGALPECRNCHHLEKK